MGEPLTVNIPHSLGKAGAKTRIGGGIHQLGEIIPGAALSGERWEDDSFFFTLEAMGQRVGSEIQVRDDEVYAIFDLPPMLALFANKIKEKMQKEGTKMLE